MVRILENLNHYSYDLEKQKIKPLDDFLDKFPIGESIRKKFDYSVKRIKDFVIQSVRMVQMVAAAMFMSVGLGLVIMFTNVLL